MNCPKCNTVLSENSVVCPGCGEKVALNAQKEKTDLAIQKAKGVISNAFSNTMFLVYTIILSVISVIYLVSSILSLTSFNIPSIIINVLITIFAIVSTVSAWMLYGNSQSRDPKTVKNLRFFPAVEHVFSVIICVFGGFVSAFILVIGFLGSTILSAIKDNMAAVSDFLSGFFGEESTESVSAVVDALDNLINMGAAVLIVLAIVIAVVLMFYLVNYSMVFGKIKKYWITLSGACETGDYNLTVKPPRIRLFIFGGLAVVEAVACMVVLSDVMTAIMTLVLGGYFVISALIFSSVHEAAKKAVEEKEREELLLNEISEKTEDEIRMAEKRRQDEFMAMMKQTVAKSANSNVSSEAEAPKPEETSDNANT